METAVGAPAQAKPYILLVFSNLFVYVHVFDHSTLTPNSSKSTENTSEMQGYSEAAKSTTELAASRRPQNT